MFIECITVCVNYGDFLAWTISNRHIFGRNKWNQSNWIIVTDTKDLHTKRICDYYNIRCIQTDVFYENGQTFNKANGINAGLEKLQKKEWVLHLDADIYLPPEVEFILPNLDLDPTALYGFDRFNCFSFEDFAYFLTLPKLSHENWIFTHADLFNIGARVVAYKTDGYIPIGFGQMWNPKVSKIKTYPNEHDTAARTDMQFAKQFPKNKRRFIPDFIGIHLESQLPEKMGMNWNGRTTIPFGPDKFVAEDLKRREFEQMINDKVNEKIKWHIGNGKITDSSY